MIAVSYFGSGFGPIGMLLLVNVVAIYIQIGANSMLPLPASMLMWICGVTPLGNSQCTSILIDCLINVASVLPFYRRPIAVEISLIACEG